jgi:hypothetical protein
MQRTKTTNREAAQINCPSHQTNPGGYFTHLPRVCQDSLFAHGCALAQASFSLRSRLQGTQRMPQPFAHCGLAGRLL